MTTRLAIDNQHADTVVDEVFDLDEDDGRHAWGHVEALLESGLSRSDTFVGFEIPLVEMWRHRA